MNPSGSFMICFGRNSNSGCSKEEANHYKPEANGVRILSSVRLGCALRYFAGGSPYDLMVKFGISHTEILDSVWFVVQASNKLKQFLADHDKQKQIASAFCKASTIGFSSCAGAIDGILIWIAKPSEIDAAKCGVGRKKFFVDKKISLD
jgi:hypothetical protein